MNFWLGVGAVLAAPILLPAVMAGTKPLAKAAIKGYFSLASTVREVAAEASEQMSDLVAEAKSEYEAGGLLSTEANGTAKRSRRKKAA